MEDTVERLLAENKILRETINRQRDAFIRWREIIRAVSNAADMQTAPPACHLLRERDEWYEHLTDDEKADLSAALSIACGEDVPEAT